MGDPCPHESISINMIWEGGVVVSSETVCDDCGTALS